MHASGQPFLDRFATTPIDGRVVFLNYEVSGDQLAAWADSLGIPRERLYLVNLRGRRNLLADEDGRAELVGLLTAAEGEILVVDPFGRRSPAGHRMTLPSSGRGSCSWTPWPPTPASPKWYSPRTPAGTANGPAVPLRSRTGLTRWSPSSVTRTPGNGSCEGRDVEIPESRLDYDPATRRLTFTGEGSRTAVRATKRLDDLVAAVVEVVTAEAGIITSGIEVGLRDMASRYSAETPAKAPGQQSIGSSSNAFRASKRRAQHHNLKGRVPPSDPEYPGVSSEYPRVPYRDGGY